MSEPIPEETEGWGPEKPLPDDYQIFENPSGITFYVPTDSAAANVPYSFKVFAGSINKEEVIEDGGLFVKVDGSRAMAGDFDAGTQNIVNANDVGAVSVSSDTAVVSGQATAGSVVVSNVVASDTAAGRNITHSLSEPTGGKDGDIWFTYKDE
ncbi:MAG: hypothetical protein VW715_17255 [Rhodospirillales bacterium]